MGIEVSSLSEDHKYWFLGHNSFDKKIIVDAVFFYTGTVRIVKVGEKSKQIAALYNYELTAMGLKPFCLMRFVKLCFGTEASWGCGAHVPSALRCGYSSWQSRNAKYKRLDPTRVA